ncbi:hypothetical protein B0T10DRAFT_404384 [Thelonectria olida]|uniref:Uncharacterized protein n=1 Tax=Thelonectria olida TaxID=1576542 RepID=A0A9P8W3F2_9HYPO|nr:hypothetical protein B0T10DRAFT_404384 [Thelonectria olida]
MRRLCPDFGFGSHAPWPPVDPGMSIDEFNSQIHNLQDAINASWKHLYQNMATRGDSIITHLWDISQRTDQETSLESLLQQTWRETRDEYNSQAARPSGILPGFMLDPEGEISATHDPDLDNFSLDFLRDISETGTDLPYHYPLFRNGANWDDGSAEMKRLREGDTAAWDELKVPQERHQKILAFNVNVVEHLQRVRASYLVPHINLDDLSDLWYLLWFIYTRATMHHVQMMTKDRELTYLGRASKILAGPYIPQATFGFTPEPCQFGLIEVADFVAGPGSAPIRPKFHQQTGGIDKVYYDGEVAYGSMELWVILQSQTITYTFLNRLVSNLYDITQVASGGKVAELRELNEFEDEWRISYNEIQGWRWQDLPSLYQYLEPGQFLRPSFYITHFTEKLEAAESHLEKLFSDPEYFVGTILEQRDHHWSNLPVNYSVRRTKHMEEYDTTKYRHELYYDLVRRVLRRAVFNYFSWNLILEKLKEFKRVHAVLSNTTSEPAVLKQAQDKQMNLKTELPLIVRYCAVLFMKEFRSGLIHAASKPIRDHYTRISDPNEDLDNIPKGLKTPFTRGLYKAPDLTARPLKRITHLDEDDMPRMVGELINNFIADSTATMYVGVRKITSRLQRYLDDVDDQETRSVFTDYVADTVDSLDALAELALRIDDNDSVGWKIVLAKFRKVDETTEILQGLISRACQGHSIDLPFFDEFRFEDAIPERRVLRIFRLIDEAQGFGPLGITLGQAEGDLKRLGASMLRDLIFKSNKKASFKVSIQNLKRLEEKMKVTRHQYPFHPREQPLDLDTEAGNRTRPLMKTWLAEAARITKEKKKRMERLRKFRKAKVSNKGFDEEVMNEVNRRQMMQRREAKESKRRRRAALKRKASEWDPGAQDEPVTGLQSGVEAMVVNQLEAMDTDEAPSAELEVAQPAPAQPAPGSPARPVVPQQALPPVPPPRVVPRAAPAPPALAPNGEPKTELHKSIWETFMGIYGVTKTKVSWSDLVKAMRSLGYQDEGRGGSHGVFTRTLGCPWPEDALPSGRNIQLAKNHEGERRGADWRKTKDWGFRLRERGLNFDFVKAWFQRK